MLLSSSLLRCFLRLAFPSLVLLSGLQASPINNEESSSAEKTIRVAASFVSQKQKHDLAASENILIVDVTAYLKPESGYYYKVEELIEKCKASLLAKINANKGVKNYLERLAAYDANREKKNDPPLSGDIKAEIGHVSLSVTSRARIFLYDGKEKKWIWEGHDSETPLTTYEEWNEFLKKLRKDYRWTTPKDITFYGKNKKGKKVLFSEFFNSLELNNNIPVSLNVYQGFNLWLKRDYEPASIPVEPSEQATLGLKDLLKKQKKIPLGKNQNIYVDLQNTYNTPNIPTKSTPKKPLPYEIHYGMLCVEYPYLKSNRFAFIPLKASDNYTNVTDRIVNHFLLTSPRNLSNGTYTIVVNSTKTAANEETYFTSTYFTDLKKNMPYIVNLKLVPLKDLKKNEETLKKLGAYIFSAKDKMSEPILPLLSLVVLVVIGLYFFSPAQPAKKATPTKKKPAEKKGTL